MITANPLGFGQLYNDNGILEDIPIYSNQYYSVATHSNGKLQALDMWTTSTQQQQHPTMKYSLSFLYKGVYKVDVVIITYIP